MSPLGSSRRIIVADDHPLFRAALVQAVGNALSGADIIEADSADAVRHAAESAVEPDLCTLDLHMPGAYGFSTLAFLRGNFPGLPVLIISATVDHAVITEAMSLGAAGYLPKSSPPAAIVESVHAVLAGGTWLPPDYHPGAQANPELQHVANQIASLTPQQFRVLTRIADGLLNKQIAYEMNVTEATIKAHVTSILRKLSVSNRTAAVIKARSLDVNNPDEQMPLSQPQPG